VPAVAVAEDRDAVPDNALSLFVMIVPAVAVAVEIDAVPIKACDVPPPALGKKIVFCGTGCHSWYGLSDSWATIDGSIAVSKYKVKSMLPGKKLE
jgi:hypothetical protein